MAAIQTAPRFRGRPSGRLWRVCAAVLIGSIALGAAHAANNSVQGAKKDDGYDTDAPTAILIEAKSGSILFEKNADELRAPSSMMKLMTAEVVFDAIMKGEIKLNY
jgi:D-alanyl-D-alanine carboxypeptidase (penicillin-binding protein 5/6)